MQEVLMEKLRAAIKEMPCNSLSRVYPYQLQEWTDVKREDFIKFVQELIEENLLHEKYDFQCNCGNECTVYEKVLLEKGYRCPECEKEYSKKEIENRGTVLYEIDKSSVMEYKREFIDAKSRIRKVIEYENRKRENEALQLAYDSSDFSRQERKVKVFLSYSHEDETYKKMLDQHLSPLRRNKKIITWNDRKLLPGSKLDEEIKEQLRTGDIIILMVSSSFIDSDYCYETEMKEAIERAERGECRIIPVIVRPCMWKETPFGEFLALPEDGTAISLYENKDEAYTEIAQGVKKIVQEIEQKYDK